MKVDFGKTAKDYAEHRAGFPDRFFGRLFEAGFARPGARTLDLGTGTGTAAFGPVPESARPPAPRLSRVSMPPSPRCLPPLIPLTRWQSRTGCSSSPASSRHKSCSPVADGIPQHFHAARCHQRHIEPDFVPRPIRVRGERQAGRLQQPCLLAWRNGIGGIRETAARLHLDKNQPFRIRHHKIDFASASPQPPGKHGIAVLLQLPCHHLLGAPPQRFRGPALGGRAGP